MGHLGQNKKARTAFLLGSTTSMSPKDSPAFSRAKQSAVVMAAGRVKIGAERYDANKAMVERCLIELCLQMPPRAVDVLEHLVEIQTVMEVVGSGAGPGSTHKTILLNKLIDITKRAERIVIEAAPRLLQEISVREDLSPKDRIHVAQNLRNRLKRIDAEIVRRVEVGRRFTLQEYAPAKPIITPKPPKMTFDAAGRPCARPRKPFTIKPKERERRRQLGKAHGPKAIARGRDEKGRIMSFAEIARRAALKAAESASI